MKRYFFIMLVFFTVFVITNCGKKNNNQNASTSGKSTATTDSKPSSNGSSATINAELMNKLKAIVIDPKCKIDPSNGYVTGCDDLLDSVTKSIRSIGHVNALPTLASALGGSDIKLSTVASSFLYGQYQGFTVKPGDISPDLANSLIDTLKSLKQGVAVNAAPAVVNAATLSGLENKLYPVVDGHSEPRVKQIGYQFLLTYGRAKTFPKIKEISSSNKTEDIILALKAFRNIYNLTDQEKDLMCPWGQSYLSNPDINIATEAGERMIGQCKGKYIDTLLTEAQNRLKKKQVTREFILMMRNMCSSFMGEKTAGVEKQCNSNYSFLEKVANTNGIDNFVRGLALDSIYMQRRDEKTLKLMKKYKNHKIKEIKKYANDAIKTLEASLKGKKK